MKEKIVIALGGNAIQTKEATAEAQQTAIRRAMQNLKLHQRVLSFHMVMAHKLEVY